MDVSAAQVNSNRLSSKANINLAIEPEYAGTCIFLIVLAAIFRALLTVRFRFDEILSILTHRHEDGNTSEKHPYQGIREPPENRTLPQRPQRWTVSRAITLAGVDVVIAGVSYLL